MATTSTSNDVSTFVEDVKKKPDRTDSMLSGARTPSTVGGLTPGFRGRLDSSDPFWGLEFTEEMAMAALKKEIKKRVWPESRVHTDGSAKHRTWRLDPADFDMGHMFAVGEDTDGYVMKFGDFEMEYFFGDPNPPPEAVPLSWNMWEIELFGPMHENGVEGMFKPEPIRDVDRFVEHGHDYDTIEESELSDFWECWELSPVAHIGVVDAVMDLLKEPVYVLTIDQSVLKGAEWLSLIRVHPVIEYPIILSNSGSSCLPQSGLLETARPPQPALCHGVLPLLAGGIMQARLKALLNRLTHHEIIEADPRVQGESIRKWLWRAVLDKSLTEAWPSTKWLGPYEKLYVEAQAVFIRDPGAISSLLNAEHISGHTIVDVSACPGLAVARAAVAARVLLIEGSDMLNIIEYDVSCMAQEVATLIVISAMETTWPYQQQQQQEGAGGTVDTEVFSHRFEREPWVPLSRLSAAFSYSNSPLIPHQWRPKEPSQFTLLAERLSRAIETGKVYMGPKYLPASYSLRDRARSSLDYLSWCLTQQPHRCRLSPREALSPLASWWEYVGLRLADLVWGIRDLMRLHQPGVLLHAYWLEHWPSATTKPPTKPSVYGADAFAWKRPAREGCDTLALRVPPPPRYTVIDAVGSAAAIPIDHLASYLELRSSDMAQSWRSYPTLNHFAELTATFTKWLFILALLHSTVPSVDILPSRLGPDSSSVFTHSLLAVACCSDTGLWVGLLGTWIKIPVSLIGEWPVDNYVLGLLILPLISRSKLQWPALAYPIVEEWALGSIALSTLLPAVGIQAVWLYVLGAILGNIICREIEAQAGIAALISYLVGETIFGHRSDFDSLSLVWFQDLSPSAFAFVYAVLASITYRVFSPRCRRELMSLKRGEWRVSCGAVVAFGLICSKFGEYLSILSKLS